MSATDPRRVALLARPGPARDKLRLALEEAGAELVLEGDPTQIDLAALAAVSPQVVLVALEPAIEDALAGLQEALEAPGTTVIYDEVDLAAKREGWQAQRWARHLSAKLNGHDDVLPPGREEGDPVPGPGLPVTPAQLHADAPIATHLDEAALAADGIAADALGVHGDFNATPAAAGGPPPIPALSTPEALDALPALPALALVPELGEATPVAKHIDHSLDFDPAAYDDAEFGTLDMQVDSGDVQVTSSLPSAPATLAPDWSLAGGETENDAGEDGANAGEPAESALQAPPPPAADAPPPPAAGDWSLVADDAPLAPVRSTATAPVFDSLDPNLALVDLEADAAAAAAEDDPTAPPKGAVLVLAGIGGPDAIRNLLAELRADFGPPLLVRLRLDGGRYDNLVRQMQRVSPLPVGLARMHDALERGHVYVLPDNVGVDDGATGPVFAEMESEAQLIDALRPEHSALLLLSGADPARIDAAITAAGRGALLLGQSPEGCYDPAASQVLAERGVDLANPAALVARLNERWPGAATKDPA